MDAGRIEAALHTLEEEVRALQPDLVDAGLAVRLMALFVRAERVGAAGTALLARRVGDTALLARTVGTSVGKARAVLGLSERLRDTPGLDRAVRRAEVSLDQATEIARAETAAPGSAETLVAVAREAPHHVLRERARALALEAARHDLAVRQHRARYASHRVTDLGMVHIEAELEPLVGAPIVSRIEAAAEQRARRAGDAAAAEAFSAHLADAFADVCSGSSGGGRHPEVVVLVSHGVVERGWSSVEEGEICSIPGVGPVSPSAAREIAEDAFLSGVFYDGKDLRHIRRWTRSVPSEVRLALRLGSPPDFTGAICVDCGNRHRLEMDHDTPHAAGGTASARNLRPRCTRCHRAKTRRDRRRLRAGMAVSTGGHSERDPPRGARRR